jgi:hypothetical protein
MGKLSFVCVKCGFSAFLDSKAVAENSGWQFQQSLDGGEEACCPACDADGFCEKEAKTKTRTAGDPGR